MRIVVISDSHGKSRAIDKILASQPDAKAVFFLGDCVRDIEDFEFIYSDKTFYTVSGNCDYNSFLPSTGVATIDGVRIFYTHGHTLNVKYTKEHLLKTLKQNDCKIGLYGHTHISDIVYEDGIYLVNPGSVSRSRNGCESYAVIDITEKGIMPIIITI
ncbi:MAG: metallophosphoesterase [Clostridia bacterium]|nr:metallophosphoesterase [Clostridia bacterium]